MKLEELFEKFPNELIQLGIDWEQARHMSTGLIFQIIQLHKRVQKLEAEILRIVGVDRPNA